MCDARTRLCTIWNGFDEGRSATDEEEGVETKEPLKPECLTGWEGWFTPAQGRVAQPERG
jgi:hypothetical protein